MSGLKGRSVPWRPIAVSLTDPPESFIGTHRLRATHFGYAPLERDSVVVRQYATTVVDFTLDRKVD